jgi:hypothetical protein
MASTAKIEETLPTERETHYTSELEKLTSDPTITKHPDPKFHASFRDPDELGEEEPAEVEEFTAPARRVYPTSTDARLRRSPKE